MPKLSAKFPLLCIHGPVQIKEQVKNGQKLDKKTGEMKDNWVESGKMLNQYTFMCGNEPVKGEFPLSTQFKIGSQYECEQEIWLKYFGLREAVITEVKVK